MPYTGSKSSIAQGTVISIMVGSTATPIGEVKGIATSGRQVGSEDVTNMLSTEKEYLPTLMDNGTWEISGDRVGSDVGLVACEAAFVALTVSSFKVQLPIASSQTTTGDLYAFSGFVQSIDYSFASEKVTTFSMKVKLTGALTLTPGT